MNGSARRRSQRSGKPRPERRAVRSTSTDRLDSTSPQTRDGETVLPFRDRAGAQLRGVLDGAAIGIAVVDAGGRILDCNLVLRDMLGYCASEISSVTLAGIRHPGDADFVPGLCCLPTGGGPRHRSVDTRYIRKDGQVIWCHVTAAPLRTAGEAVPEFVITVENITERKWILDALEEKEKQLRAVIDQSRDGIFIGTPQGLVVMYNRAMEAICGYTMEEVNDQGWLDLAIPDPVHRTTVAEVAERAVAGASGIAEVPLVRKDGQTAWVLISMTPIVAGGQKFALGMITDVTRRKQQEEQLAYLAAHDMLTGLPNRFVLEREVGKELAVARIRGTQGVLLFADVDHFKLVNDTLGHGAGDQLLITLSRLVKGRLRGEDLMARVGGDEFAVLLSDTSMEAAWMIANRLCEEVNAFPFVLENRTFHLGLSLGMAPISGQADVAAVLSQADAAMYVAKSSGRNRVAVWQPGMGDPAEAPNQRAKQDLALPAQDPVVRTREAQSSHR